MQERNRSSFRLIFPENLEKGAVLAFLRSLSGLPKSMFGQFGIVFEAWADNSGIHHRFTVPSHKADVIDQLRTAVHGIRITPDEGKPVAILDYAMEVGLSNLEATIKMDNPAALSSQLLTSLQPVQPNETVILQWVIVPAKQTPARTMGSLPRPIRMPTGGILSGVFNASNSLMHGLVGGAMNAHYNNPDRIKASHDKNREPIFSCVARIGVKTTTKERALQLQERVLDTLKSANSPMTQFVQRGFRSPKQIARWLERGAVPITGLPCCLNAAELSALVAFPIDSPRVPGLQLGGTNQVPPSYDVPSEGRILAKSNFPGVERPLAVSRPDSLRHLHTLGATGVGKSTLLLNLITQDMNYGAGVAVIDPKGDLITDVLDRIPVGREQDVILIDPTDKHRMVGLNMLAGGTENPTLVTSNVVGMFKKLYKDGWGARLEYIMSSAIRTLATIPGMTMLELSPLLTNKVFRSRLLAGLPMSLPLKEFWEQYDNLKLSEQSDRIGSIMNKVEAWTIQDDLRHIMAQPDPPLNMDDVLANRKILLVYLPKGRLPAEGTGSLIGSMVMMMLWQAAQRRIDLPESDRTPFYCYVDEFQDFLNLSTPFEDVLSQARGYGFSLTLSHQNLGQLPNSEGNKVQDAILANAATRVMFQTSASDAAILARQYSTYLQPSDLQNLGAFEVVVSIAGRAGIKTPPITAITYPKPPVTGMAEVARWASSVNYAARREDVEESVAKRREMFTQNENFGQRPRQD